MADVMRIKQSTMADIADETREIMGTTGKLSPAQMQEQLAAANAEIEKHTTLISKISDVLTTKAGGGAAVETCELEITFSGNAAGYPSSGGVRLSYSQLISGSITTVDETLSSDSVVLSGVPIESIVVIFVEDGLGILGTLTTNNVKIVGKEDYTGKYNVFAPTGNNASWEVG